MSAPLLHFRLLGEAAVFTGSGPKVRVSAQKGMALLAYLAMNPGPNSRSSLADLLWGDRVDRQARQSLRQCMVGLRRDLGETTRVLTGDDHTVGLDHALIAVDVREFERAAAAPGHADRLRCLQLPSGLFLEGFHVGAEAFDQWVEAERNRLAAIATRTFIQLAEHAEAEGDAANALLALERLIATDPGEEEWHRRLIRAVSKHRGPDAAIGRAKWLASELRRHVDAEPSAETRELLEAIRREAAAARTRETEPVMTAAAVPESASELPPVQEAGAVEALPSPVATPQPGTPWRRFQPRRYAAGAAGVVVGLLVAAGLGAVLVGHGSATNPVAQAPEQASSPQPQKEAWYGPRPDSPAASRSNDVVAVAVLPFGNLGEPGADADTIADMVTDDVINALSRFPEVRVISRQTVMSYRGKRVDVAAIGAELDVRFVLQGGISRSDDGLLVSVELVDAGSRRHVWSGRFERAGAQTAAIQDEIVKSLGRELQIGIAQAESAQTSEPVGVRELLYKGRAALNEAATSGRDALQRAEKLFSEALQQDPDNASAQTGLAGYHIHMAIQLFAPDPKPHLARAETLLKAALERRPGAAGAHSYLGVVYLARGQAENAAQSLRRAIELNPSHAQSYGQLGRSLLRLGRAEEALEHIRYAMRLSPRDPVMAYWLGFAGAAELELKRSNRAIEYLERALVLNPEQPRTLLTFAAALALAGRPDEARAKFEQVQKALPHITGEKLLERLFGSNAGAPQSQLAEGLRRVVAAGRSWESPLPKRTDAPALRRDIIPVAILPFKTYESSEQVRLLADMMTDDLINMLSRVPSFRVISRQTSRSYAQPVDIAAIGAELGVRYILEGTMRVQGDRLRVNVELIDPATRLPVWSDRIEREGADRHAVQDEIVARLARELQFELYPVESERRSQDADADAVAYRGWAAMSAAYARSGMDAFNKAEALFRQALERDPQHFSARLGIAAFHANVGAQVLDDHSRAHLDTAVELLRQLVAQDPNSSSAHHFLGLADGARGNLPEAVAAFTRAVELNPSAAGSHAHLGHRWAMTGKPAEGLEYLRYAMRLSPRDPNMAYWLEFAGCAELELHRYAEAIETFRRSIALNPGYPRSLVGMIAAQTLSGNVEGARPYIDKLKTLVPSLTPQQMFARFGRKPGLAPQLREGLRIALTPPA